MKIIDTSENIFRVVDERGVGICTFYKRKDAEEYINIKEDLKLNKEIQKFISSQKPGIVLTQEQNEKLWELI